MSLVTRISTLWVLLALLVPYLVAVTHPLEDDIWWVLKLGELLAAGHPLGEEVLTFPPHAPGYVSAQWLSQLWYHGVHRLLGFEGVIFVNALQAVAAFGLVLHLSRGRSGDLRVAAVCTLIGAAIAATNLSPRAQTIALLLFALTSWLLQTRGGGWPRLAALALTAVVWANVHGSFWLGPALAVLLWTGDRTRYLALAAAVQLLAALINPHGPEVFRYVAAVIANPVIRAAVTEWRPPGLDDLSGAAFYCSLAATAVIVLRRRAWGEALPLIFFAVLGLLAVRNLVWWALVAPPFWAGYFRSAAAPTQARDRLRRTPHRPYVNAALVTLVLLFMLLSTPWTKPLNPFLPEARKPVVSPELPHEAAAYLASRGPDGRVYAFQPWGGYLEWRLWPKSQLMVDGRIELRPAAVWEDYARISAGDSSWRERLDRHGIRVLVVSRRHQGALVERLVEAGLSPLYQDPVAGVYITMQQ